MFFIFSISIFSVFGQTWVQGYQETPCANVRGECMKTSGKCSGEFLAGKCPTQKSDVKCCVPKTSASSDGASKCGGSDKYTSTMEMIFGHEGKCQNSASDRGKELTKFL